MIDRAADGGAGQHATPMPLFCWRMAWPGVPAYAEPSLNHCTSRWTAPPRWTCAASTSSPPSPPSASSATARVSRVPGQPGQPASLWCPRRFAVWHPATVWCPLFDAESTHVLRSFHYRQPTTHSPAAACALPCARVSACNHPASLPARALSPHYLSCHTFGAAAADDVVRLGHHEHESYYGDRTKEDLLRMAEALAESAGQPHTFVHGVNKSAKSEGCNFSGGWARGVRRWQAGAPGMPRLAGSSWAAWT